MAAHLRDIVVPKCQTCGGKATVRLFNTWNAEIGAFCRRHGDMALREHQRRHEQREEE